VDKTVVETALGKLRGIEHNGIYAYKGIPFGAPTGGKMRFMPPGKPTPWAGVRDASRFGHQSPQNMSYVEVLSPQADASIEGYSEDCLNLNVWTPGPNTSSKRPVMFWCHGGGWAQESGTWPWVYGENLSRRGDVVVVTLNHRLNIFGYFHLGDVGGEKYASSGNVGALDLVAGLQWVHDNIAAFGGDPRNVMIFGESGGGEKVCTLLTMPQAKGLFQRAAMQSGFMLRFNSRENANELTGNMLKELEVKLSEIDKLQTMPVERLLAALAKIVIPGPGPLQFGPILDGKILTEHPFSPAASPVSADIPLLVGCNTHEHSFMALRSDEAAFNLDETQFQQRVVDLVGKSNVMHIVNAYKKIYPGMGLSDLYFRLVTDRGMRLNGINLSERKFIQGEAPVYMYLFAWQSPALSGKIRATHTVEIPFVFYNTDIPKEMTKGGPEVKELAGRMSDAWIQFAHTGNPNHKGLPEWPAYDLVNRTTMVFDNTCMAVNNPSRVERELWEDLKFVR
jgi:para-nitrobenzyl esterase